MQPFLCRLALVATAGILLSPAAAARAHGVEALQPSPTNLLTTPDRSQRTGLRVNLPVPDDCLPGHPNDCDDVADLNVLNGFNLQPRLTLPFSGPIDPATATSATIQLYDLSCRACAPVGIDQRVWEPLTSTLYAESAAFLKEGTRYLLVVTRDVRTPAGRRLERLELHEAGERGRAAKQYRKELKRALDIVGAEKDAAAASLFTTQTATDGLRAIRAQLQAASPPPATIDAIVPVGTVRDFQFQRQGTDGPALTASPTPGFAAVLAAGPAARLVFGSYPSPQYETAERVIAPVPAVQSTEQVRFNLVLPGTPAPAGGYPVAIFGHGFGDSKNNSPYAVAASMASAGIATIAINVVGHGGGPGGKLVLRTLTGTIEVPAGGRGIDQDGNHAIDVTEGLSAAPTHPLVATRDGLRQTAVDLMQLVRVIRGGGIPELSTTRLYYFGQSLGGIYGTVLLGSEPLLRAGVPNVPGGSIVEVARLGAFRGLIGLALLVHQPPLYNASPPNGVNFVEDMPLRGQPLLVSTTPGATAVARYLEWSEWAQQSGNPVSYAPLVPHDRVIVQFAKGDRTVPNPTTTAILRAGGLADRTTYFRNDIAGPGGTPLYANPHTFLTSLPATSAIQAQIQIATFFASDGSVTIDPDGPGPVFETPIAGPPPEGLN